MGLFRLFLVLLLLPLAAVSGQDTSPPQLQPRPTAPSLPPPGRSYRQVTVDVQVADRSGTPVRGLQKQDFTLLDDKQPKNIVSFHAVESAADSTGDPPVEIVLVVDAVNTSFHDLSFAREEVKQFLLQNGGKLAQPVSLVIFSDAGTKIQDGSSRDGKAQAALLDQYETGLRSTTRSQGFYGAAERFDLSVNALTSLVAHEESQPARKLMIWLSAGWPLLSAPNVELSRKNEEKLFDSIVALSAGLRQARITLYNIAPFGPANAGRIRSSYYEEFLKGVTSPSRAVPANLSLEVLAVQSGGRVFNTTNDLTAALSNCAADANSFYVLSFNSAVPDRPNEYHALRITVDRPGVTTRTRTGYYAQP